MENIKPPSYEEAVAAGASAPPWTTNMTHITNEVLHNVPTAPTLSAIESVRAPIVSLLRLTDPDLRAALSLHMNDFCCKGSKFIREMIITDIQNVNAFHYRLELFGEKRDCTPRFTGYYGQTIDGHEKGAAPDKWTVPIGRPIKFVDHQITTEMPHSAYVKECSTCEGEKKIDCTNCWARGTVNCHRCGGDEDVKDFNCRICKGSGKEKCSKCSGRAMINCYFCDGCGKVKYYMQMTVTWKNHVDEFVSNRFNLPEDLILKTSGQEIFTKQAKQVEPLNTADVDLNAASAVLIEKNHSSIKNEAILAQRHSLRVIPLTRATYIWRNQKGEFYVYGFERNVYFKEYPQQCCWSGCKVN